MRDNFGNYIGSVGDGNHISLVGASTHIEEMTDINQLALEYVFLDKRLKEEWRTRIVKNGVLLLLCFIVFGLTVLYVWANRLEGFRLQDVNGYMIDMLKQFWPALLANLASLFMGAICFGNLSRATELESELKKSKTVAKNRAQKITPKKEWKSSWGIACKAAHGKIATSRGEE